MKDLIIKEGYKPFESYEKTQQAIKLVKDFFQQELAYRLKLLRVTAPLFVTSKSGLNDNLSGVERVVSFTVKDLNEENAEIVQSLAKWKRMALGKFKVEPHRGIYTDMNAIRRDEKLDNLHSIYVDQWDWEKVITRSDRTSEYLRSTVKILYECFKNLEEYVNNLYPELVLMMPDDIFFITSQELQKMYPNIPAPQREYEIVKPLLKTFKLPKGKEMKKIVLSVGTNDDRVGKSVDELSKYMKNEGVQHIFYHMDGGHENKIWKNSLYNFARYVFK